MPHHVYCFSICCASSLFYFLTKDSETICWKEKMINTITLGPSILLWKWNTHNESPRSENRIGLIVDCVLLATTVYYLSTIVNMYSQILLSYFGFYFYSFDSLFFLIFFFSKSIVPGNFTPKFELWTIVPKLSINWRRISLFFENKQTFLESWHFLV